MNMNYGKQPTCSENMLPPWGLCNMASASRVILEGLLPSDIPAACAVKHVPLWQDSSWGRLPLHAEHYSAPSLMLTCKESQESHEASPMASSPVTPALQNSILKVEAKTPPALARTTSQGHLDTVLSGNLCRLEISLAFMAGLV